MIIKNEKENNFFFKLLTRFARFDEMGFEKLCPSADSLLTLDKVK